MGRSKYIYIIYYLKYQLLKEFQRCSPCQKTQGFPGYQLQFGMGHPIREGISLMPITFAYCLVHVHLKHKQYDDLTIAIAHIGRYVFIYIYDSIYISRFIQ